MSKQRVSDGMVEVLRFMTERGERELPTVTVHAATLKGLNQRGLVEPSEFEPAFPVPLPARWRITDKGRQLLREIDEAADKVDLRRKK